MRSIPRKQADRIYAYYFMDMTLEEIAASYGTSVQAVYYSIQVSKKNLNKILEKHFKETLKIPPDASFLGGQFDFIVCHENGINRAKKNLAKRCGQ